MEKKIGSLKLSEFMEKEVTQCVASAAEKVLKELPRTIENRLSGKILGVLGIEESFGRLKLDRDSPLSDYVKERAVSLAKDALGPINVKIGKEQIDAIRAEYTRVFVSTIKDSIRSKAKEHAERVANEMMSDEINTLTQDLTLDQIAQLERKRLQLDGDNNSVFANLATIVDFDGENGSEHLDDD